MRVKLFLIFTYLSVGAWCQQSLSLNEYPQVGVFERFQQKMFGAVIETLSDPRTLSDSEEVLLLLSQLKTGYQNAEKIELWVLDHKDHPITPLVNYYLGEYFFYADDATKARRYLTNSSFESLSAADQGNYGFIYGLVNLRDGEFSSAKRLFAIARENGFENTAKLNYYQAYSLYHTEDYSLALEGFNSVKENSEFAASAKYFIAKILLENSEVDEVISLAKSELSEEKSITNSGFNQLIGEAYAIKGDKFKTDAYFQRAIDLHPSEPSAALYYQAGVAKFKIGNEDLAIAYLTKSGILGGEYAQLSAFQLGRLFLKKKAYKKSLTAYIEASVSKDDDIRRESIYQAAKINAELGNFSEAINYSKDYLKDYKSDKRSESLQDLIAESYLRTSNYDLAIDHLKEVGINNMPKQKVYQKVTYQKALRSFNDAEFMTSKDWFSESLKFTPDRNLSDQANYHLGEIAMRENKFELAIKRYNNQSVVNEVSYYGIGYAYFNLNRYEEAILPFKRATKSGNRQVQVDSKVRLADCFYATKSYSEALNTYNEVYRIDRSAYIAFQRGVLLKSLEREEEALVAFEEIFTSQKYGDDALFQSGMIHFEAARFEQAEVMFSKMINQFSSSPLLFEARLNRGVSRKNLGKVKSSKQDYEYILETDITSKESLNAILGLQELQQEGIAISKLDRYISNYKVAHPGSGSLEVIEFEAAKRLYFDFSYQASIEAFEKFLNEYAASSDRREAQYYLADSYYRIGDFENSKNVFDKLKPVRSSFTGRVLNRLGEINQALANVSESEEAYLLLKELDLTPKDTYNALAGLMSLYYDTKQYEKAIDLADESLASNWKPINGVQEATLIKAKSYLAINESDLAQGEFQKLVAGSDAYGAESNYFIGKFQFDKGKYEESLNTLFDLNAKYGSYQSWVDKSYLLIAENYLAKEEFFQAKATLRSIIQHSENQSIKGEASQLLREIESGQSINDTTQNED